MNLNLKINTILIFSTINILLYLFFFSNFGYFELKNKTLLKESLEREIHALSKENQILEDKIIKDDFSKEKYELYVFKFEKDVIKSKENNQGLFLSWNQKEYYKLLYCFYCVIGYLYIIFFKKN